MRLACPRDRASLQVEPDGSLICPHGHRYPVVDGIPVLLRDDVPETIPIARASLARARGDAGTIDTRAPDLFLESLGISEEEKQIAVDLQKKGSRIDPVVSVIIAATSGYGYKHLIGDLAGYPIPELRLADGQGKTLLDIGCNWGRWSIAAARKGYRVVGIDPSLGAVMAARRVARQLGVDAEFVVADARYLPFADGSFDTVFSYSVIQHFSKPDATQTFSEVSRLLAPAGRCLIQMAHTIGVRSLYHLARRGFREGSGFDVRYWTIPALRNVFAKHIGPASVSVHCYFGLGLEPSDRHLLPRRAARLLSVSEMLRAASESLPLLAYVADSVYVSAFKNGPT
jgi:2-polyprenyl-3-methyl-5-hydroxy-6-metoxy-1,4-benzoquinol methylase/uncharacterized protein YbaR (Trm112 family)